MRNEAVIEAQRNKQTRARLVLVGLFVLFFIPVLGAVFVAVKAPHWIPFGTVNRGQLVKPPVANALLGMLSLDAGPADQRGPSQPWIIAHVGQSLCDDNCEYALVQMRQARLALGKDAHRVQRWWLLTNRPQPDTLTAVMQSYPGLRIGLLQDPSTLAATAVSTTSVQIIDPAGFLILRYPLDGREKEPGKGLASALLKDFKRLLKISEQRR